MTAARDRFIYVLMRVLEREASPEDRDEFRALLKAHPAFIELYHEQMLAHTLLACVTSEAEGQSEPDGGAAIRPCRSRLGAKRLLSRRRVARWSVAAAAAILLGGAALWQIGDRAGRVKGKQDAGPAVETVTYVDPEVGGVVTRPDADALVLAETVLSEGVRGNLEEAFLAPGSRDYVSEIRLERGRFTFRLETGVTCCLVGPAEVKFRDDANVVLRRGTLLAEVSPQAVGFLVETPTMRVRDLGTRFGVSVGTSGASDVMVAKGRVQVEDETGRSVRTLAAGWGLRMEKTAQFNFLRACGELPASLAQWSERLPPDGSRGEDKKGKKTLGLTSVGVDAVKSAAVMNANVGDGSWRRTDNTDLLNPARWSDPANWVDGWVSGGLESQASFTNLFPEAVCRAVEIPPEGVSLGRFWFKNFGGPVAARNGAYLLVSGGPMRLEGERPRIDSAADQLWLFSKLQGINGLSTCADYSINVFADSSYTGLTKVESGYWITHFDGVADSAEPVLYDYASTNDYVLDGGRLSFYGRRAMASPVTSTWSVVQGQTSVRHVDGAATGSLTPGSAVFGDGLPRGAFVARIVDARHFQLSEAATASGDGIRLSFAPVLSECYQRIGSVECRHNNSAFIVNKNGAQAMRVEVGELKGFANVLQRVSTGQQPGVLAFRNTREYAGLYTLQGGWLELMRDAKGSSVLSNVCVAADSTVSVPDADGVASFSRLSGTQTLTKTGPGRLAAHVAEGAALSFCVEEGALELTGAPVLRSMQLTLKSGTRLALPQAGTLEVSRLTLSGDVWLEGPGKLVVTGGITQSGTVHWTEGGGLAVSGVGGAVEPPAPAVAADPAFWVDACALTNAGAAGVVLERGTNFVTRWSDVRGSGRNFATNLALRPALLLNELNGLPAVRFKRHYKGSSAQSEALYWDKPLRDIRAVFMVVGSQEGGGILLGSTVAQNTRDFCRNAWLLPSAPLLNADSSAALRNGLFYLNGRPINPLVSGYNGFYQLVEAYPAGPVSASAFAVDRDIPNGNGCQRICEMILYSRALTEQERLNTAEYLMRKWLGRGTPRAGAAPDLSAVEAAGGLSLSVVRTNDCLSVGRYAGGGELVKTGAGTLALSSVDLAAGRLEVRGGLLDVRAGDPSDRIPPGAFLHLDASAAGSFSNVLINGTNFVEEWRQCRGGAVFARMRNTTARLRPCLVTNALNGLPVVDFGPLMTNNPANPLQCFLELSAACSNLMDAFVVIGSQAGGNTVLGTKGPARHFWRAGNAAAAPLLNDAHAPAHLVMGETRLNGETVAPTACGLSGGYDLVSFSAYGGGAIYADALANDAYMRTGGQRLGEVLIYDRALSERERREIEVYLMKKWFGVALPGSEAARVGALAVAPGAQVKTRARLAVGGLSGGGRIAGDLTLTAGAELVAAARGGQLAPAAFAGAVSFAGGGTVRITGEAEGLAVGRYTLLACESLEGGEVLLERWRIEGAPEGYGAALKSDAAHVYLQLSPKGTMMIVR